MNKNLLNKKLKSVYKSADNTTAKLTNKANQDLIRLYKSSLSDIRNEISKLYEKMGEDISLASAHRMNGLYNLEDSITGILKELNDNSYEVIKDSLSTVYNFNYKQLPSAIKEISSNAVFGKVNKEVIQKSIENPLQYLNKNTKLTNKTIREELTKGLIKGDSYPKTAKLITERINVSYSNANRIVRTESHRIQSEARFDSFDDTRLAANDLGLNVVQVWIASDGGNHRHGFMNNQISDESGMFDFDGIPVEGPGCTGDSGNDCNCMCTTGVEVI